MACTPLEPHYNDRSGSARDGPSSISFEPMSKLISKAMSELGRRRWANKSTEERAAAMEKARAARDLSPEARAEMGRRLAAARAAKRAKSQAQ